VTRTQPCSLAPATTAAVLAPAGTHTRRNVDAEAATSDTARVAQGAHAAPDLAAVAASLASVSDQLASLARQVAELVAAGAGTSGGGLAILAQREAVMDAMPAMKLVLSQAETAELLGVHARTLARMRAAGGGPRAIRVRGAIRYRRADVERWLEGKRS